MSRNKIFQEIFSWVLDKQTKEIPWQENPESCGKRILQDLGENQARSCQEKVRFFGKFSRGFLTKN